MRIVPFWRPGLTGNIIRIYVIVNAPTSVFCNSRRTLILLANFQSFRITGGEWIGETLERLAPKALCGECYDLAKRFHWGTTLARKAVGRAGFRGIAEQRADLLLTKLVPRHEPCGNKLALH
jgi:hypothetical protein